MKTNSLCRAVGTLTLSLGIFAGSLSIVHAETTVPRGSLDVDKDLVRVSTRSNLEWEIEYPESITEIVTVDPPGTIIPKKDLEMRVRVLGVAFQSGNTLLPVAAYWSYNNSSWDNFFYGTSEDVNSNDVKISVDVKQSDTIDFGARGSSGNGWYPFNNTKTESQYVTVLGNGSSAPSYAPAYNQSSVTSFLKPYIDSDGRINIGERDLIILWECYTASPGSQYFDMQDIVVLVSFE
ncbi:MAG: hypothetical protein ACSHX7_14675 [Luteolibacter sp.]